MTKLLRIILVALLIQSCNEESAPESKTENNQAISDSLSLELEELGEKYFNGFAVAIVDTSNILYEKGFGFANVKSKKLYTENTLQPIASVSKTFIGLALMKAQELGLLNLDDAVNKHIPFEVINPNFPEEKITIRHLATHTSSINDNEYYGGKSYVLKDKLDSTIVDFDNIPQGFNPNHTFIPLSEFLENYLSAEGKWYNDNAFTNYKPSQYFNYTNVGATLGAYIIEIVAKQSFADFTTEHILKPLKMNSSGWSYESVDFENISSLYENRETEFPYYSLITYPDGGFITNVNDLGKYMTELIKGYSGNGTILTKESYNELFKTQLAAENYQEERGTTNPYDDEFNSGIFMGFTPIGSIGHTGGDPGVSSLFFFNTKTKIGRILILNTDIDSQEGFDAYFGIMNTLEEYSNKL